MAGWAKNWACHQWSEAATGDILIFTDADVRWQPDALTAVVAELAQHEVDAMSIWPMQVTGTWAERLVVPLMAFLILGYTPLRLFNRVNWPGTAIATGQYLLFVRSAYESIGGHAVARSAIVEDVVLLHRVKRARLWMHNVDGAGLLTCRCTIGGAKCWLALEKIF